MEIKIRVKVKNITNGECSIGTVFVCNECSTWLSIYDDHGKILFSCPESEHENVHKEKFGKI